MNNFKPKKEVKSKEVTHMSNRTRLMFAVSATLLFWFTCFLVGTAINISLGAHHDIVLFNLEQVGMTQESLTKLCTDIQSFFVPLTCDVK